MLPQKCLSFYQLRGEVVVTLSYGNLLGSVLVLVFLFSSSLAQAYLGPGLGMTASLALTVLAISITLSIGYLFFSALRRIIRGRKSDRPIHEVRDDL